MNRRSLLAAFLSTPLFALFPKLEVAWRRRQLASLVAEYRRNTERFRVEELAFIRETEERRRLLAMMPALVSAMYPESVVFLDT